MAKRVEIKEEETLTTKWEVLAHFFNNETQETTEYHADVEGDFPDMSSVWDYVKDIAADFDSHIVAFRAHQDHSGGTVLSDSKAIIPVETPHVEVRKEIKDTVFDDPAVFGVYYTPYKGAALCTYKVNEKEQDQ